MLPISIDGSEWRFINISGFVEFEKWVRDFADTDPAELVLAYEIYQYKGNWAVGCLMVNFHNKSNEMLFRLVWL